MCSVDPPNSAFTKNCANYTWAFCKDAGYNKINKPKVIKWMTFQLIFEAMTDIYPASLQKFQKLIEILLTLPTYTPWCIAKLTSQIQTVVQVSHNELNTGLMQALITLI